MSQRRIVLIDGHIIAQWYEIGKWWTCSKASNNNEGDFAVWAGLNCESDLRPARKLIGDVPVVCTDRKPLQRGHTWHIGTEKEWYVDEHDQVAKSYSEALRQLAKMVD